MSNKRKGDDEMHAANDSDGEDRKEDKRQRHEPAAAAAASSSSAAAAAASSSAAAAPSAAAASSSASAAPVAASGPLNKLEKLDCAQCQGEFKAADGAARALPCGHILCSDCVKDNLTRTPGSVLCPEGHGPQKISAPASAAPTMEDWLRQVPPAKELIAAIRNQQSLMTRLAQRDAECSHEGCTSEVAHFCPDCGDLCDTHERKRHALAHFQSHKLTMVPIAGKAEFFQHQQQNKFAGPAAEIRSQAASRVLQQQRIIAVSKDQLKQLEAQTQLQLQKKRQEVEADEKALGALTHAAELMRTATPSELFVMEADRLEAEKAAVARPVSGSTILKKVGDARIADLQTFLSDGRSLSKAKLIYRAKRDGFKRQEWWRQCGGKSNLLTIVKVKGNGFVFVAFTAFQWPVGVPTNEQLIADPSGTTFLISLVNAHNRAVKLRLKGSHKADAGVGYLGCGPTFGSDDVLLMHRASASSKGANYTLPHSFEFDSVADGGAPIVYDKTLLAGDDGNGEEYSLFAAAEIETWQL